MGMVYLLIAISAVIINICLIVWIYGIHENGKIQKELLLSQNDKIDSQSNILLAQLGLLAGIAEKSGMPVDDINELVKDYGVEYDAS
jgi:uncharacterized membrane protein YjdF